MTVCPYCGAGCKMNLIVENNVVVGAEPLDGITNEGNLCLKGLVGFDFINDTKILTPRILHRSSASPGRKRSTSRQRACSRSSRSTAPNRSCSPVRRAARATRPTS